MRGAANLTSAMEVAADLRQRILLGELKPGARLKIDDVASLCDVSHMPVRVALQVLEAEGVLDVYPHRGAVIKPVDARFVRSMLELRAAVEVMLSEKCARLIDKDGLAELEGLAIDFEAAAQRKDRTPSSTRTCACTMRSAGPRTTRRRCACSHAGAC